MGDGAAEPFNGVHIMGNIQTAGDLIPWPNHDGRNKFDRPPRSKNQPYHNQPSGASSGNVSAVEQKRRLCLWLPFFRK